MFENYNPNLLLTILRVGSELRVHLSQMNLLGISLFSRESLQTNLTHADWLTHDTKRA
jgi:hypothetical protein